MVGQRRLRQMAADGVLLAAIAALLLFAPAAALAVAGAPIPPRTPRPQQVTASGPAVRQLPAGLPAGVTVPRRAADLEPLAIRALGPEGGRELVALLGRTTELQNENKGTPYPYRFSPVVALLDRAPAQGRSAAAGELGAVLMLLAGRDDDHVAMNAAAAAFAVLDRARGRISMPRRTRSSPASNDAFPARSASAPAALTSICGLRWPSFPASRSPPGTSCASPRPVTGRCWRPIPARRFPGWPGR